MFQILKKLNRNKEKFEKVFVEQKIFRNKIFYNSGLSVKLEDYRTMLNKLIDIQSQNNMIKIREERDNKINGAMNFK